MKKEIYFDNASTTKISGEVLNAMMPLLSECYGNSNSVHAMGRRANKYLDESRDQIAKTLNVKPTEIYFTSGGTEANNWAIIGLAMANRRKGNHIITSKIEHHSVLDACKQLEANGFRVTYLDVDQYGFINFADLLGSICADTILISIMSANNEIGTIQNIKAISEIVKFYGACFHVDGVQALGVMPINVNDLGIDLLSISAHKIHGPKGAGALYIRKGVKIDKFMIGGEQEMNRRGGTVNVPAVVGFGKACELNNRDMAFRDKKLFEISQYFIKKIEYEVPDIIINGNQNQKVNNIVSVTFLGIEGEYLVTLLDMKGIAVSTGSACASGSFQKSHVLKAMGRTDQEVRGTIRFSFDVSTTKEDVDYVVRTLCEEVEKLRKDSPVKYKKKDS